MADNSLDKTGANILIEALQKTVLIDYMASLEFR